MLTRFDRGLFVALAAYVIMLIVLPVALPIPAFKWVMSEAGPFEVGALLLWPAAAAVLAVRIRPFTSRTLAFATMFLLFACREADLQKAFTSQSISKLDYYRHGADPLWEKLIAGAAALAFVGLAAYTLFVSARFLLRQGGLKSRSGTWLAVAWGLLVFTKILDRSKQVLAESLGISMPPEIDLIKAAFEEGLEAFSPFLFIVSAWISQVERRYLS